MTLVGRIGSALWLAAAALILLWPTPVDRGLDGWLLRTLRALHAHGVPRWVGYGTVEFTANILFFVPLGAFLVLALMRRLGLWSAPVAIAAGFALSLAAELAQAAFLPDRVASAADVAANTLGAAIAAPLALAFALGSRARRPRRAALRSRVTARGW